MSDALYERYKDALRRGHVAAVRGRSGEALDAYGEAAAIAPDRALPLVGMGGVLARLGKTSDALTAYDAALERAPTDDGALRGRADVLEAAGDRVGAAATLDRLAVVLDRGGKLPEAAEAARLALELAESRGRRDAVRGYVDRLSLAAQEGAAAEELARGTRILDPIVVAGPAEADEPVEPEPVFDERLATSQVEDALAAGDIGMARDLAIAAVAGFRDLDRPAAAADVGYLVLAATPADPGIHLALAELYLDQGWRALAIDKLALLGQLAALDEDPATTARVCAIARDRSLDAPRLAAICP